MRIAAEVNGRPVVAEAPQRMTLADFLRERLQLTGTHLGCEHGVCGACTVLLDGAAVRSCLLLAVQAVGHRVQTVEGLAGPDGLHPLQRAFHQHHALQCGYCTAGFLMALMELWPPGSGPATGITREQVDEALGGQLCRCTGYVGIRRAAYAAFGVDEIPHAR
jgi:aerobic-type carbon monoxide dehydrogenase small subunit (CoxS/CutS family)